MSKFRRPTKEELRDIDEAYGFIAPHKDNLVVEGYQGVMHGLSTAGQGFASTIDKFTGKTKVKEELEDNLRYHQDWKPYPSYKALSMHPTDISRTVGTGLGVVLPTIVIFIILYLFLRKIITCDIPCKECRHNIAKYTKKCANCGRIYCKTCLASIDKDTMICSDCGAIYGEKPKLDNVTRLVIFCFMILILIFWIIGFCTSFGGIIVYVSANVGFFVILFLMLEKWTNLPLGSSIKDAKIKKQKKDVLSIVAVDELESGKLNKLAWSQAFKKAKGDEQKAKAIYIELREKDV
ncbi:MAG: hypothetical protein L3J71_08905 [Victivallaceae bacterium]|nr:hypothetical protein [Victivallaceae bacterium]